MKNDHQPYFLGIDIGTDSAGYAVTDEMYRLLRFRGEPIWGVTTFEAAALADERRLKRTERRRLDRRQWRGKLVEEIFAQDICRIDPNFFLRRQESALFAEDSAHGVALFDSGITDAEYHIKYPTIHHLILELMNSRQPHDIRLVYLACAWLVSHRGHFLTNVSAEQVKDFKQPYQDFLDCFTNSYECRLPWSDTISSDMVQEIMQAKVGVRQKQELFRANVFEGKKPSKKAEEEFPFSLDAIVTLLSGGKVAPKDLFCNDAYAEIESVCLDMDDEKFASILSELGDDADLLRTMRAMYDCAILNIMLRGETSISAAKVAVYEQHRKDLEFLKYFIRKYQKSSYDKIFRNADTANYVAYSGNVKSCVRAELVKKVKKDAFCDYLKSIIKNITPEDEDLEKYADMKARLDLYTFLPKQTDSDNRVIPHQLYEFELREILRNARDYLPMLRQKDADGITNEEKLCSIFTFRIPYYVGPLNAHSSHAWIKRKQGKIYPWNFAEMVDLDASEQNFIRRMTNTCTYLPGESVLPYCSLLYSRFMVLNEINGLKVNERSIPVSVKQAIYNDLFERFSNRVTLKSISDYLLSRGYINDGDSVSGVDTVIKANLKPYHSFQRLMKSGTLTSAQVEDIINHAAYSEEKSRMNRWLTANYPVLSEADRKYILHLNLKEFGRLSGRFLTEIMGSARDGNGEALSIMGALWQTNDNLMQLLSEKYTFKDSIADCIQAYYSDPDHKKTLNDRLDDLYVSNAVKRPIIRSLDIVSDVVKAMSYPPSKIFVEMARGGAPEQKGKRTSTRKQQIFELYKKVKDEDVPRLQQELEAMGDMADNRLQSDRLFLYYMQLGRCMYTNAPIAIDRLSSEVYDIDHIYPQSRVQDDSILNNKVLCLSSANGAKSDRYPIEAPIRKKMSGFWAYLKNNGLITEEKYRRLTRASTFTEEELHQFINRQLVETRQSTKVVAQLLQERYPDTEIVYVKAGMVSQFRQEFDVLKCRSVNDLHHAKDAYLNIVVGNVYHEKFTRRWFDVKQEYTLNVRPLFASSVTVNGKTIWQGGNDLEKVKKVLSKNAIHLTRYAFCRKGGFFDQMPLKAATGLIPRKEGLPTEKYGGYRKPAVSFYLLVSYTIGRKKDIMFAPVELLVAERVKQDATYALEYISSVVSAINGGKSVDHVEILLQGRMIKINTVLSLDGMLVTLRGKSNGGACIIVASHLPLVFSYSDEKYIKAMEATLEKMRRNPQLQFDPIHSSINADRNVALFDALSKKATTTVFHKCPGNIGVVLTSGRERFIQLSEMEQVQTLMNILSWFNQAQTCDLTAIGGVKKAGAKMLNSRIAAYKKSYNDVRILDLSPAGLFISRSENLLDLL